jgi:RNA polymerase sigma factor (sigma-70 family)
MALPTTTRSLTPIGLASLLARLHSDPEQAPLEYERLRRTLVRFFDWRGALAPDECADVALDRLARKLEQAVDIADVRQYARGIARLVLLELRRQPAFSPLEDVAAMPLPESPADDEELRDCFDRCLAELPADGQSLVLRYYEGERDVRIANRRRMAAALNLSENALRSRVQRLRDRLEQCVHACVAGRTGRQP